MQSRLHYLISSTAILNPVPLQQPPPPVPAPAPALPRHHCCPCAWLLSRSMFSKLIGKCGTCQYFITFYSGITFHWMDRWYFAYPFTNDGLLGGFYLLAIINKASMKFAYKRCVNMCFHSFLGYIPKSGIVRSYGDSVTFWGLATVFHSSHFTFPPAMYSGSFSYIIAGNLVIVHLFDCSRSVGYEVVFTWFQSAFSLMTNDAAFKLSNLSFNHTFLSWHWRAGVRLQLGSTSINNSVFKERALPNAVNNMNSHTEVQWQVCERSRKKYFTLHCSSD